MTLSEVAVMIKPPTRSVVVYKEKIVKTVGRGYSESFYSIISSIPGKPGTIPRKYNPDRARQLMKEAGHSKGVECTLSFFAEAEKDHWNAIQANLAAVGIKVTLNPLSRPAFMGKMFSGVSGNELRMGNMPHQPDPFLILESHISPKSALYKELLPEFWKRPVNAGPMERRWRYLWQFG